MATKPNFIKSVELWEAGVLSKFIGSIGKQKVALDQRIQQAFVQVVGQSIVHRNSTPAHQLFEATGTSSRRDALVAAFEKFGNLYWSKVEKRVMFADRSKLDKNSPHYAELKWDEEYATMVAATPWYSLKKEPEPKSEYDVESELGKFINRFKKYIGDPHITVKHKDLLGKMQAVYNSYVMGQIPLMTEEEQTKLLAEGKKNVDTSKLREKFNVTEAGQGAEPAKS